MSRVGHLSRRFVGALSPVPPRAEDVAWVGTVLAPTELTLWTAMPVHDRRHSIAVARRTATALEGTADASDDWVAAALLHDVGKLDAHLGPFRRALATAAGAAAGPGIADAWSTKRGITRRFGLYLRHPELGAVRIRFVGGRERAARWAEVHQTLQPDDRTTWDGLDFPEPVVRALHDADDD
jgi:hypothetical protein